MRLRLLVLSVSLLASTCGCDMIYGLLHKPGAEERKILGEVVFNEYNPKVEELQQILKVFGYPIGRADGKFGAGTRDAVARFQTEEGLEVTRFVDKPTWARIEFYANGPFIHNRQLNARAVQKALKKAGFELGKIDGMMGTQTRNAVKAFQRQKGLGGDGHIGLKTIKALMPYLPESIPVPAEKSK